MISTLTLALAAALPAPRPINVDSLLREMPDLSLLAQRSDPWYRYRQETSYDRAMQGDPYANGDFGKFLRDENVEGRKEQVMADVKGPGALVRLWSANPAGTIRFYFDGEAQPRLVADLKELFSGKHPLFPEPFAYMASQGANLYYPMPFAKGLKVTWDGGGKIPNSGLYYAVGFREYAPGSRITTFTPDAARKASTEMTRVAKALMPAAPGPVAVSSLAPGESLERSFTAANGGEIRDLRVTLRTPDAPNLGWDDPKRIHNLLRGLRLRASFDGETTVDLPLGDFYGVPLGPVDYDSLPVSVRKDGTMIARWSMPFQKKARVWVVNEGKAPVELGVSMRMQARRWTPGTYLFHAGWNAQTKPTMPRYDFTFADVKGEGRFVGAGLQVSNPSPAWWGEGDEKVSVDGEPFPSLFGTGTEDYFGYAWCDPTPFSRPYHCQPATPNRGNMGQTENLRFHIVDDIPFKKALRFDMEAWHWADVKATYATTAYWYARPGSTLPKAPNASSLMIPEVRLPEPVKDAIEGENLKWTINGGFSEMQSGFGELSGGRQFWWREPSPGAVATVEIPIATDGRYELVANLGHARDYGRFRITVNWGGAKEIDLYQSGLEWRQESLGAFDLPAGKATVRFEVLEGNAAMNPRLNLLGVDYFLLKRQ
jgi:hypothetical protein